MNDFERGASDERLISDALDTAGNGDVRELFAIAERIGTNFFHSADDQDFGYLITPGRRLLRSIMIHLTAAGNRQHRAVEHPHTISGHTAFVRIAEKGKDTVGCREIGRVERIKTGKGCLCVVIRIFDVISDGIIKHAGVPSDLSVPAKNGLAVGEREGVGIDGGSEVTVCVYRCEPGDVRQRVLILLLAPDQKEAVIAELDQMRVRRHALAAFFVACQHFDRGAFELLVRNGNEDIPCVVRVLIKVLIVDDRAGSDTGFVGDLKASKLNAGVVVTGSTGL